MGKVDPSNRARSQPRSIAAPALEAGRLQRTAHGERFDALIIGRGYGLQGYCTFPRSKMSCGRSSSVKTGCFR